MNQEPIIVVRSSIRYRLHTSSHFATTVEGVRFTNSSSDELARVIARKFGWTVSSTKARFIITERES